MKSIVLGRSLPKIFISKNRAILCCCCCCHTTKEQRQREKERFSFLDETMRCRCEDRHHHFVYRCYAQYVPLLIFKRRTPENRCSHLRYLQSFESVGKCLIDRSIEMQLKFDDVNDRISISAENRSSARSHNGLLLYSLSLSPAG